MATVTYKNARQAVGTSMTTVYTAPASTTSIIFGCTIANVNGSNAADISAQWVDSSGSTTTKIGHTINVNPDSSISIIIDPIVLETGDYLQLQASSASYLEATVGIAEIV